MSVSQSVRNALVRNVIFSSDIIDKQLNYFRRFLSNHKIVLSNLHPLLFCYDIWLCCWHILIPSCTGCYVCTPICAVLATYLSFHLPEEFDNIIRYINILFIFLPGLGSCPLASVKSSYYNF